MQKVLILDLGGPYNQLVARRVRECQVYCEIYPAAKMTWEQIRAYDPIGIILIGCPEESIPEPELPEEIFRSGIPVLGICRGCHVMVQQLGGTLEPGGDAGEYGRTLTRLDTEDTLFEDTYPDAITWMRRWANVTSLPEGFHATASSASCSVAALACPEKKLYGVQFHPEVSHTDRGTQMLRNFLYQICEAEGDWILEDYIPVVIRQLRQKIGDRKVLLALSGGVDSSVAAALLNRAVGSQLTCVFVDHGLLRKDEGDQVEAAFSGKELHFIRVNNEKRVLQALSGVTDPRIKRKIIDEEFYRVFEAEAKKLGQVDFLAQGTIYPDVIEAVGTDSVVKSHYDVGRLPEHVDFREVVEPLRQLFKDEVRELGRVMGLPEYLVGRQPFPGPGLAIRIMGEVTPERVRILREADGVFTQVMETAHMNRTTAQYFAVLSNERNLDGTPEYTLALRAVNTDDFLTAKWARLPYELLDKISGEIIRNVPHIARVVYDITSKPPATIEWE